MNIKVLQQQIAKFASERDWDQFHTPKNLVMALAGEAGELLEVFQWLSGEQSIHENMTREQVGDAAEEIADVMIYTLRLCDKLQIDLESAVLAKLEKNAEKYPVSLSKGSAAKYTKLDD